MFWRVIKVLNEQKIYKANYMQEIIIMPTKENLDRLEEHCRRSIKYDIGKRFREHEITLSLIYKYRQLESNNQKLIEKLEERIKQITSSKTFDYAGTEWQESWVVEELQEILKIAKGEKE